MRRVLLASVLVAAALFAFAPRASAAAMGGYIEYGNGDGDATEDYDLYGEGPEVDLDPWSFGGGFALETSPLGDGIVSYRLHLGYDALTLRDGLDQDLEMDGIAWDNLLAFGGDVTERARFWMGPSVRLAYHNGEIDDSDAPGLLSYDAWLGSVGVGFSAGVNFLLGRSALFCPTVGWRYTWYQGEFDYEADTGLGIEKSGGDLEVETGMFFVGIDLMML
jgi:hypothetical protein